MSNGTAFHEPTVRANTDTSKMTSYIPLWAMLLGIFLLTSNNTENTWILLHAEYQYFVQIIKCMCNHITLSVSKSSVSKMKMMFHLFLLEVNVILKRNAKLEWIRAKTWHTNGDVPLWKSQQNINISEAFFELGCLVHAKDDVYKSPVIVLLMNSTHSFAAIMCTFLHVSSVHVMWIYTCLLKKISEKDSSVYFIATAVQ